MMRRMRMIRRIRMIRMRMRTGMRDGEGFAVLRRFLSEAKKTGGH